MATGDSPAAARRRVRLFLRHAREQKGLTQSQVAEEMEWSLSKVMRIESGEVTIAPNDLRPLLAYLDVSDKAVVDRLVEDVRISRRRRQAWWDEPEFRETLTVALRQLAQFESDAVAARYFQGVVFPGRLQTPAYAAAILDKYRDELTEEQIKMRLDARMRRRTAFLSGKKSTVFALLDQSVLHREVGGAGVLAEQISELLNLVRQKRLIVRVVPFSLDGPLPLYGSYELLHLDDQDDENALMYRETSGDRDEIVEDRAVIKRHRELFELLWANALDERSSERFMADRVRALTGEGGSTGH